MPEIFDSSHHNRHRAAQVDDEPVTSGEDATHFQAIEPQSARHFHHRTADEYSEVMFESHSSHNPLDAFAAKPHSVAFDSQIKGERVLLLLRRHPITQIPWVITAIGLILLPFFIGFGFTFLSYFPGTYQMAIIIAWYGFVFSFILESFLMWFFNAYIITDERVIDVDFYSLIYKNISAAKLDNIEDITATTGGSIRSIFDFGTIKVQTAGTATEFEFEDVPHPAKVTKLLNELLLEEEREKLEGRAN
jgi:hypothetical protein